MRKLIGGLLLVAVVWQVALAGGMTGDIFSPHTPTAIGDVTPNTGQFTTITLTGGGMQITGPSNATLSITAGFGQNLGLSAGAGGSVNTNSPFNFNSTVSEQASSAFNFDLSNSSGAFKTTTGATTVGGGNNQVTVSTGTAATTISATAATAGAGLRNSTTRNIIRNGSVAAVDCAGGAINATVTQMIDGSIFTCATAQTLTFPTWQGASGVVQGLPGTPAIGDWIGPIVVVSTASATFTVAGGTGGTIVGNTTVANGSTDYWCRITSVTANSETASCYGGGGNGGGFEGHSGAYNSANLASATAFGEFTIAAASTLKGDSKMSHDIAGAGTGTFVVKLCSDGTTCGAGNIYLTCTAGATCATAAAGRRDACTVTKSAVPAATTLTWSVTTACGTTDPGVNLDAHWTTP